MKKLQFIVLITALAFGFTSCQEKVEQPERSGFSWYFESDYNLAKSNPNPPVINVGDPIMFQAEKKDAKMYTIWPGQSNNNYHNRNLSHSIEDAEENLVSMNTRGRALIFRNGVFRSQSAFMYTEAGTFTVHLVARNYNPETNEYKESIDSAQITVQDTLVELFHTPGYDASRYIFLPISPSEVSGVVPEVDGTNVTLHVPHDTDLSSVRIQLRAGRSILSGDEILPPDRAGRIFFQGDLNTPKTITVTNLDGTLSRDYTIIAVKEAAPAEI